MRADEVHAAARDVLRFWLEETGEEMRFAKDAALDQAIGDRFGALRQQVVGGDATGWRAAPDTLLAAIILVDQFGRNLFRNRPEAFAHDGLARELTRLAIRNGWDTGMTGTERQFVYMPLMHSENPGDQAESVALFESVGDDEAHRFAILHRDVIARFGRFPGRNEALGRVSTPAEREYLSQPGAGF